MSGPMLWLQNCLNRTAADREEDGKSTNFNTLYFFTLLCVCVFSALRLIKHIISAVWSVSETVVLRSPGLSQPVPLVPLTEANEDAMDNKSFRKLLRKLGMRAPANEQVCYFTSF